MKMTMYFKGGQPVSSEEVHVACSVKCYIVGRESCDQSGIDDRSCSIRM